MWEERLRLGLGWDPRGGHGHDIPGKLLKGSSNQIGHQVAAESSYHVTLGVTPGVQPERALFSRLALG